MTQGPNPNIYGMLKYMSTEPLFNADEMINAQNQGAIKNAFKAGTITNPDGSISYDKKMTLGALVNNPTAFMKAQEYFSTNEKTQRENELANQGLEQEKRRQLISAAIGNQPQYTRFRQEALNKGFFKPEELPENYDENFLKFERDKNTNFKNNYQATQLEYLKNKAEAQRDLGYLNLDQRKDFFEAGYNQKNNQFQTTQDRLMKEAEDKKEWERFKAEQDVMWKEKENEYKRQMLEIQKKNVESQIQDREADNKRNDKKVSGKKTGSGFGLGKPMPGQKKLDEDFAKDYNDWTSGKQKAAAIELNSLSGVIQDLKSKKVTTGGITGFFGPYLTSDEVLNAQAKVKKSLLNSIKTVLGGTLTDSDVKTQIETVWIPSDSTENNLARIENLYNELIQTYADKNNKAKHFENYGTLAGYQQNAISDQQISQNNKLMNKSWTDVQRQEQLIQKFIDRNKSRDPSLNRKKAIEILKKEGKL